MNIKIIINFITKVKKFSIIDLSIWTLKYFINNHNLKSLNSYLWAFHFPLLESVALQKKCDYSFGDQSGVLGHVPGAFMKKANISNSEFLELARKFEGKSMTLFIDNIRLYRRPLKFSDWQHLKPISKEDRRWMSQFNDEDLLKLCSSLKNNKFIIFTALEDIPLDNYIKVPKNVVAIHAANAVIFGGKIHPYPHGLERKMHKGYFRHLILKQFLLDDTKPNKLLYVNHRKDTGNRSNLYMLFKNKKWATVSERVGYDTFLEAIKRHKFVLCPSGNGIESARNWETLYMKRVPVFKKHPYLQEMFKDFPALFVSDFSKVTEKMLKDNDHLYQKAQKIDYNKLNLNTVFKERTKYGV